MSIKIANDTANGSATLQPSNTATGDVVHTLPAFSTELAPRMQLMTAQNSTSGTSIDFTGIPSWAKKITVMFNGVSTNGASPILVQVGTSSGVVVLGYHAMAGYSNSAGQYILSTAGFPIDGALSSVATSVRYGNVQLYNCNDNAWISGVAMFSDGYIVFGGGAGGIKLSSTLDRIRVTTVNGTDTFDAGQINIMYEG